MAQLSRPYQIGLATVALLAAVWLVLLQGHSSSPSASAPAPSAPTTVHTTASTKAVHAQDGGQSTGTSTIYHGAAPGVEGLSKAIAKAHGAVKTSEQNASQLEQKSAQASSPSTSAVAPASTTAGPSTTASPSTTKSTTKSTTTSTTKSSAPARSKTATGAKGAAGTESVARQHTVESELAAGKIVLILFWNPKGADDLAVHKAMAQLRGRAGLDIAIQEAPASEVASFGSITRGAQVYGTPTLLIVDKSGKARTLTGVQDALTIEQAIQETRHP